MVYATSIMLYVFFVMCLSVCYFVFKLYWGCCTLTFLVCVSQGHKYMVQAEVLYKSWDLDESQLAFVHMLRDLEKNELRGTYLRESNMPCQRFNHTKLLKEKTEKKATIYSMICFPWKHKKYFVNLK